MQIFLMILMHIVECLKMTNTLLLGILVILATNLVLTHTNLKTWLSKIKWGVKVVAEKLDNRIMRLVDNRK